jgi:hypothetical protein
MAGLEATLTIHGKDDTGPALAAIEKLLAATEKQIAAFEKMAATVGQT